MNKIILTYCLLVYCVLSTNFGHVAGECIGEECTFSCNCVGGAPCNNATGECPNGCLQLMPVGYGWGRPACQIGNLALERPATQSSFYMNDTKRKASIAVDGEVSDTVTATDVHFPTTEHWWQVELLYPAVIINVTVFNRKLYFERLSYFNVRIGNSSGPKDNPICRYYNGVVPSSGTGTVSCPDLMMGRFVSIQLTENSLLSSLGGGHHLSLAEVVVMGYRYASCPAGFQTSPGCLEPCQDKKFGESCASDCNCHDQTEVCNKQTGSCPQSGCKIWYAGDDCHTDIPDAGNPGIPSISVTTSSSFQITWTAPSNFPRNLQQYYIYEVQLKTTDQWISAVNTILTAATVHGLKYNTNYRVRVILYRTHRGQRDAGPFSSEVSAKTNCTKPSKLSNVHIAMWIQNQIYSSPAKIDVQWQKLSTHEFGCDNITKYQLSLTERDTGQSYIKDTPSTESTTVLEDIQWNIHYIITVAVYNNEHYWSITDEIPFELNQERCDANTGISIGLSVIIALSAIWAIVVTVLLFRRQRNPPTTSTSTGNEKQEFDHQYEHLGLDIKNKNPTSNTSGEYEEPRGHIQIVDYERLRLEKTYMNSPIQPSS